MEGIPGWFAPPRRGLAQPNRKLVWRWHSPSKYTKPVWFIGVCEVLPKGNAWEPWRGRVRVARVSRAYRTGKAHVEGLVYERLFQTLFAGRMQEWVRARMEEVIGIFEEAGDDGQAMRLARGVRRGRTLAQVRTEMEEEHRRRTSRPAYDHDYGGRRRSNYRERGPDRDEPPPREPGGLGGALNRFLGRKQIQTEERQGRR